MEAGTNAAWNVYVCVCGGGGGAAKENGKGNVRKVVGRKGDGKGWR